MFLVVDPAQLKNVLGRSVFNKPISPEYHLAFGDGSESLWRSLIVVNLTGKAGKC